MRARATRWVMVAVALSVAIPASATAQVPHTVVEGESLWSIAAVNGISVDELAAANGLSAEAQLLTGDVVQIPPPSGVGSGGASGSGACVYDCQSSVHPHPTDESVSAGLLSAEAAEEGMSPDLVQAIAWSESGWSNAAVSSADARGVMQLIPDTWEFVDSQLAEKPLDPASARDNVAAGAEYLHYLYHLSGGDPEQTIASYYQGPNRSSWLPETHDYVSQIQATQARFGGG